MRGKALADPAHERALPLSGKLDQFALLFEGLRRLQAAVRFKVRMPYVVQQQVWCVLWMFLD